MIHETSSHLLILDLHLISACIVDKGQSSLPTEGIPTQGESERRTAKYNSRDHAMILPFTTTPGALLLSETAQGIHGDRVTAGRWFDLFFPEIGIVFRSSPATNTHLT